MVPTGTFIESIIHWNTEPSASQGRTRGGEENVRSPDDSELHPAAARGFAQLAGAGRDKAQGCQTHIPGMREWRIIGQKLKELHSHQYCVEKMLMQCQGAQT